MLFDNLRGQTFVRLCIARALGGDHPADVLAYAGDKFGRDDPATRILRASAGSTVPDATWGSELATYRQAAAEFLEVVYAGAIIGRLAGLRRVPLAVRTLAVASGATASWVGEGQTKPITNATFAADSLEPMKLSAITVLTQELLRLADPMAEETIRRDLIRAVQEALDLAFIDPGNAGSAGVMPAAITNGVTPVLADPGDFSASLAALIDDFQGDLATAFLVGDPVLFAKLAGVQYPLIGARGGELAGIPAIASKSVPAEASPDTHSLVLIDPAGVSFGDGTPLIDVATHATIAMIDPDQSPAEAEAVSLWQKNCAAIRVELPANWRAARPAVSILTGISTGPAV
ncbi:phage major capsid protein [Altererythrobacter salegens]|uniref:Phage major capsid protein n=1 Tax=Croceibacterium salegens TaxID=1737568 RepID=A0A6I4SUZ0_9SPHN|nr:phage major capsid protein [Croceibacterium salegens]MXO58897.1 phage major capsid protein [Croceibacterium salegens]